MASISQLGLYFDELNKIRVWDPDAAAKTKDLDDLCDGFTKSGFLGVGKEAKHYFLKFCEIESFNGMASKVITTMEELAEQVDRQKIKALGTSNLLMSMSKQRDAQRQQYQSLIVEKTTELERLRTQHQALLLIEAEQQETLSLLSQA